MSGIDKIFTESAAVFTKRYFEYLGSMLGRIDPDQVAKFADVILDARKEDRTVFFIGNGGSAATASHFANDVGVGTAAQGKPFRVLSLCDNISMMTAIANDFGYEEMFLRQLAILAKPGDVLVAISASGNSPNLLRAVEWAIDHQVLTVGLTGFDGGKLRQLVHHSVHVPSEKGDYGPVEDAHMVLDHLVSGYLGRVIRRKDSVE